MTTPADWQAAYDRLDHRRSLYTTAKPDHPKIFATGEPCDCEAGGARWEKNGVAMRVEWPPEPYRAIYDTHPADQAIRRAVERAWGPEPDAAQYEAGG